MQLLNPLITMTNAISSHRFSMNKNETIKFSIIVILAVKFTVVFQYFTSWLIFKEKIKGEREGESYETLLIKPIIIKTGTSGQTQPTLTSALPNKNAMENA